MTREKTIDLRDMDAERTAKSQHIKAWRDEEIDLESQWHIQSRAHQTHLLHNSRAYNDCWNHCSIPRVFIDCVGIVQVREARRMIQDTHANRPERRKTVQPLQIRRLPPLKLILIGRTNENTTVVVRTT